MSEHWHLHCVTCYDDLDCLSVNHGAKQLKQLWDQRHAIAAAAALCRNLPCGLEIKIDMLGQDFPAFWFVEHKDHDVRVKSEYGSFFGECAKFIKCVCCNATVTCNMSDKHDGPCKRNPIS